jgi:hypothetical protein
MIRRGKQEKWAARSQRLSAALRENLKRRKAQARGRADVGLPDEQVPAQKAQSAPDAPDFRRNQGPKSSAQTAGTDR